MKLKIRMGLEDGPGRDRFSLTTEAPADTATALPAQRVCRDVQAALRHGAVDLLPLS